MHIGNCIGLGRDLHQHRGNVLCTRRRGGGADLTGRTGIPRHTGLRQGVCCRRLCRRGVRSCSGRARCGRRGTACGGGGTLAGVDGARCGGAGRACGSAGFVCRIKRTCSRTTGRGACLSGVALCGDIRRFCVFLCGLCGSLCVLRVEPMTTGRVARRFSGNLCGDSRRHGRYGRVDDELRFGLALIRRQVRNLVQIGVGDIGHRHRQALRAAVGRNDLDGVARCRRAECVGPQRERANAGRVGGRRLDVGHDVALIDLEAVELGGDDGAGNG